MSLAVARAGAEARVLIVGTGLTGSLSCYYLRAAVSRRRPAGAPPIRVDVADMARGPGGRMSTTRFGPRDTRANTGAQFLSAASTSAIALVETASGPTHPPTGTPESPAQAAARPQPSPPLAACCSMARVPEPVRRTTHFKLYPDDAYTHWLPLQGTNSAIKHFLYGGNPDSVLFESRLQRIVATAASPGADNTVAARRLVPLFDSGGTASTAAYDVIILAMPPKDIMKFFNGSKHDAQSQADLHRRTNRGRAVTPTPRGYQDITLPGKVLKSLRRPAYIGRYSLALWFEDSRFAGAVVRAWDEKRGAHPVLDMISEQEGGVLVAQTTVELWQRLVKSRGGGRGGAKTAIVKALEDLADSRMPRPLNTKLLNWRTSQVVTGGGGGVVAAEGGRLIFTGDWCFESSFEGCNLAARAAAEGAADAIAALE